MASGVFQVAGRTVIGALGVTALYSSANLACIIGAAVGKGFFQFAELISVYDPKTSVSKKPEERNIFDRMFPTILPHTNVSWSDIGLGALGDLILATASMYALNRFSPSTVTYANELLHRVVPLQFTPNHIPVLKLFGY